MPMGEALESWNQDRGLHFPTCLVKKRLIIILTEMDNCFTVSAAGEGHESQTNVFNQSFQTGDRSRIAITY